jgi:hypothetical protein
VTAPRLLYAGLGIVALTASGEASKALAQQPRPIALSAQFVESALEFDGSIGGFVEFTDGSCLVIDVRSNELRLIDWARNTSTLVGRRGRGFGEYESPERLIDMTGDSALVYDRSSGKLLVAGARSVGDASRLKPTETRKLYLRGGDRAGRLLFVSGYRFRWPGTSVVENGPLSSADSILVLVQPARGGRTDTVARLRGPSQRLMKTSMSLGPRLGIVPANIANPLAGGDAVTMYPDGWIAIAYRDRYRIDWLPPSREPVRGRTIDEPQIAVDSRVKDEFVTELRKDIPTASAGLFDDWPETIPPFVGDALVQSHDGRLLVARTSHGPGPRLYDVINRRGQRESTLAIPRNAELLFAGRFGLYVAFTDDDGLRHLRRYSNPLR